MIENSKIEISREKIREQLLEVLAKNIGLSDKSQLDTNSTAFSTYFINTLSYLVSDLLFYISTIYDETSLVTAKLPSSIYNWATYLGYKPKKATPAKARVLVDITVERSFTCSIPYLHKFYSGDIVFRSDYDYQIEVGLNSYRIIRNDPKTGTSTIMPFDTYTKNGKTHLAFIVDVTQFDIVTETFAIPSLEHLEFYTKDIEIERDSYLYDIIVSTEYENNKYYWTENKIILMYPTDRSYELAFRNNHQFTIIFGNGIYGQQPKGLAEINMYITKGENGNVLPGTINRSDALISLYPVDFSIINVEAATGGANEENLDNVKRSSITSLKTLERIVSYEDYKNISKITGIDNVTKSSVVLKRSDLAVNDIYVYLSLTYDNKTVLTNTVPYIVSKYQKNIPPFTEINNNDSTWICPFSLSIDEKICNFHKVELKQNLAAQVLFTNTNYVSTVGTVKKKYDLSTDEYIIEVHVLSTDTTVPLDQYLTLYSELSQYNLQPYDIINNDSLYTFKYKVQRYNMEYVKNIHITTIRTDNNQTDTVYSVDLKDNNILTENYLFSDVKEYDSDNVIIYDVPVIEKNYWESLTQQQKTELLHYIDKQLYEISTSYKHRLLNTSISTKFIRTYGKLNNLKYTTPDYRVIGVFTKTDDFPSPVEKANQYLAFWSEDINDVNFEHSGKVFLSNGNEWIPLETSQGTVVKDANGVLYTTNATRWFEPNYKTPLDIIIEIHTTSSDYTLIEKTKQQIIDYVNSLDSQESLYLSNIIDNVMQLKQINYCRIIYPQTDLIYRDTFKNLTKEDLLKYTPEQVWTDKDHIKVIVKHV